MWFVLLIAAVPRLAVLPAQIAQKTKLPLSAVDEAVLAAAHSSKRFTVIGHDDINQLLRLEKQRELLGCGDATCGANLGQALGADKLLAVRLARVESAWAISAKVIDVGKAQVDARRAEMIAGGERALIEAIPALIESVLGGAPRPASTPTRPTPPPVAQDAGCDSADECARFGQKAFAANKQALALSLFQAGCHKGSARACGELGRAKLEGWAGPPDSAAAKPLVLDACSGGDGRGCRLAAQLLAQDPEYARFLEGQAKQYLDEECVRDGDACLVLADMQPDPTSARPYLKKACAIGNATACRRLAGAPAAHALHDEGPCEADTCYERGIARLHRKARAEATADFETACTGGHARACHELGKLRANADAAKARAVEEFACQREVPEACSELGSMYEQIDANESYEHYARALELFSRACEVRGERWQCCYAAWFYEYGKGTRMSASRAKNLYARCGQKR